MSLGSWRNIRVGIGIAMAVGVLAVFASPAAAGVSNGGDEIRWYSDDGPYMGNPDDPDPGKAVPFAFGTISFEQYLRLAVFRLFFTTWQIERPSAKAVAAEGTQVIIEPTEVSP